MGEGLFLWLTIITIDFKDFKGKFTIFLKLLVPILHLHLHSWHGVGSYTIFLIFYDWNELLQCCCFLPLMSCFPCYHPISNVIIITSQYCTGTITHTFVYRCAWLSRGCACFLCMLPLLDTLCDGLLCSWGMRQTQKGIITFLPKHSGSMNYLRYTRRAPRQLPRLNNTGFS